ncbi:MAG TPA: hypothetical protein VN681_02360 [Stellaceae bacterium]|jgi:hypothetical protein|nr:hypothetical protein [Stellaceae bacterium]
MRDEQPLSWVAFLQRRADNCRRLARMQRDPSIANELRGLARRYDAEAAVEATHAALRRMRGLASR